MVTEQAPKASDPFAYSRRIQADAAALGFDWPSVDGVLDKVREELDEIRDALRSGDGEHAKKELGDLLLAAINLSRFLDAEPAEVIAGANRRFEVRFAAVRQVLDSEGRAIESCTLGELDAIWNRVKDEADQRVEKGS